MNPFQRRLLSATVPAGSRIVIASGLIPQNLALRWLIKSLKAERRTMVNRRRLESLYAVCSHPSLPDGSFVECGVARGGCTAVMAFVSRGQRRVWGFDSFEGMPAQTEEDEDQGKKAVGVIAAGPDGLHEAQRTLHRFHLAHESVKLVKGWFEETLPVYASQLEPIAVLRLDSDWYKSTRYCLETLYDLVVPGGVVIVDDYNAFIGCRKAVDEFRLKRGIQNPLITTDARSEMRWHKTE
jgi:hypothetical protein